MSPIFIASYLFFATLECDHRLWSPKMYIVTNKIQKDERTYCQICNVKKNGCIIFLHSLSMFCKMPNPFLAKVANYATFQNIEKNHVSNHHKYPILD
jgi:hypothetical protein